MVYELCEMFIYSFIYLVSYLLFLILLLLTIYNNWLLFKKKNEKTLEDVSLEETFCLHTCH